MAPGLDLSHLPLAQQKVEKRSVRSDEVSFHGHLGWDVWDVSYVSRCTMVYCSTTCQKLCVSCNHNTVTISTMKTVHISFLPG